MSNTVHISPVGSAKEKYVPLKAWYNISEAWEGDFGVSFDSAVNYVRRTLCREANV